MTQGAAVSENSRFGRLLAAAEEMQTDDSVATELELQMMIERDKARLERADSVLLKARIGGQRIKQSKAKARKDVVHDVEVLARLIGGHH